MRGKRFIGVLMVLVILSMPLGSLAESVENRLKDYKEDYDGQYERILKLKTNNRADQIGMIQDLKILKGTDKGLELEKGLTRVEGAAIYLRLFGEEINQGNWQRDNKVYKSKFTDIPNWAKSDIDYLSDSGIVNGISEEEFGSNNPMAAHEFTTLVLRGLGYKDSEGEFVWNKSLEKAVEIGLLSREEKEEIEKDKLFTRDEVATIIYNALFLQFKDSSKTVIANPRDYNASPYFTKLFYLELNDEEVEELKKAMATQEYIVFDNDPDKREILLNNIHDLLDDTTKLFKRHINGVEMGFKVKKVNDIKYGQSIKDDPNYVNRHIGFTAEIVDPILGKKDIDLRILWNLRGNRLTIDTDTNYFGYTGEEIIIDYIRTVEKDLVYSQDRLWIQHGVAGVEDFANANGLEIVDGSEISRSVYSYDGKKVLDVIDIHRDGSIDYHRLKVPGTFAN